MPWFEALPTTYVLAGKTYLANFDGGDGVGVAPAPLSGPMWEVVTEMAAKMPLAAGTLSYGTPPITTVVGVGDEGGEQKHVLLDTELALHRHYLASSQFGAGDSATNLDPVTTMMQGSGGDSMPLNYKLKGSNALTEPATFGLSSIVGSNVAHENMPPYRGMNWLRRTTRLFYAIP